jgi:hypothetical protein
MMGCIRTLVSNSDVLPSPYSVPLTKWCILFVLHFKSRVAYPERMRIHLSCWIRIQVLKIASKYEIS